MALNTLCSDYLKVKKVTKQMGEFAVQSVFSVAAIREIEKALFAIEDSFVVMQRAASALFKHILLIRKEVQDFTLLVGGGNNGGDGLLLSVLLKQAGFNVVVLDCTQAQRKGDALKAYDVAQSSGVEVMKFDSQRAYSLGIVVDCVFGIGVRLPLNSFFNSVVLWVNNAKSQGAYIVAVDIPTGVDADTGYAQACVYADLTVSLVQRKIGNVLGVGGIASGSLMEESLGSDALLSSGQSVNLKTYWFDVDQLTNTKPCPRYADGHKGRYGHVAVFGGDYGYGGAAIMASEAASKSGAGTVGLMTRGEHLASALARNPNVMSVDAAHEGAIELMVRKNTVVVLGPGLGRKSWGERMFQLALGLQLPTVLDADGLFWLSQGTAKCLPSGSIITPHIGEASRLLGWSIDEIDQAPIKAALAMSKKYACVAVLKGVATIIADHLGSVYILGKSEPALSKGGSGDVLSGLIGAASAYYKTPLQAALMAVAWHNYAAGIAAGELGEHRAQPYDVLDFLE